MSSKEYQSLRDCQNFIQHYKFHSCSWLGIFRKNADLRNFIQGTKYNLTITAEQTAHSTTMFARMAEHRQKTDIPFANHSNY